MTRPIAICSLYANPLHKGHVDYLEAASKLGDVVVIINNDRQVKIKGSEPFMDENERFKIVRSLRCVTTGMISIDDDESVLKSLMLLSDLYITTPMIFCNGGDRVPGTGNSKEEDFCRRNNIKLEYNVGGGKTQSSSGLKAKQKHSPTFKQVGPSSWILGLGDDKNFYTSWNVGL